MKYACSKKPRAARTSRFPADAATAQWRHPDTKAAVSSSPHLPVWRPVCLCSGDHSLLTLIFCHSPQCFDSDPSPHHHSAPPPYHITNTGTTFFFFCHFPSFDSPSFSCPDKKKVALAEVQFQDSAHIKAGPAAAEIQS